MKREEAIKLIDTHTVCFYNEIDSPTLQALHLAIEALSAEAEPTGELIARADAIEALRGLFDMRKSRAKVIVECFGELLNALPSAEAEQGCDGCRYNTRIPQERCLRCKRYWRDRYERKGGDDE